MTWVDRCQQPAERAAISAIVLEKKKLCQVPLHEIEFNLQCD